MPKVAKVGQFRKTAAAESKTAKTSTSKASSSPFQGGGAPAPPAAEDQTSRGQRKRQAKRDQYLKRQNLVLSTLQLKRIEDQKTRIDGLDALKAALLGTTNSDSHSTTPSTTKEPTPSNALDRNKSKRELTAREVHHMELVLEHPAFTANPFATIQEHLRNTLKEQKKVLETKAAIRNKANAEHLEEAKRRKREQHEEAGGNKGKKYTAAVKARKAAMNSRRVGGNIRR
jgi:Ribosome biogenesis protein SLX9